MLIQLDDLSRAVLDRVRCATFLLLTTSHGNHQAWIAVRDGGRDARGESSRAAGRRGHSTKSRRVSVTVNLAPQPQPHAIVSAELQTSLSFQHLRAITLVLDVVRN